MVTLNLSKFKQKFPPVFFYLLSFVFVKQITNANRTMAGSISREWLSCFTCSFKGIRDGGERVEFLWDLSVCLSVIVRKNSTGLVIKFVLYSYCNCLIFVL